MSHEFVSGFSVRERPWHGLGEVLGDYPQDFREAVKLAGRAEPVEVPIHTGPTVWGSAVRPGRKIEGWKGIQLPNSADLLAVVPQSYQLVGLQTEQDILEALLGTSQNLKIETMGVLRGGRVVYTVVRLDEPIVIPGDFSPTYAYGSLLNSYDGSTALKLTHNNVRTVCWNTFQMSALAAAQGQGTEFTFRHTKNIQARIEDARRALFGIKEDHAKYIALASELTGMRITEAQRERFIVEFIPAPPETLISDRVAANIEEARGALRAVFNSRSIEPIQNTAYGLLQAAGEYLDHVRAYRSKDTYTGRTLLKAEPLKARALKLVRQVAEAN